MCNKKLYLVFLCSIILSFATDSFSFSSDEEISQNYEMLEVTGEAVKWQVFAKTEEIEKCTEDSEGFDECYIEPIYSEEIKNLNNKNIIITGYMFPLDPSEKQQNFLIGPYPTSCPFHYHAGPSKIIEVKLKKHINFSYDPVTVKGILSLDYNKESGVFYYLKQN